MRPKIEAVQAASIFYIYKPEDGVTCRHTRLSVDSVCSASCVPLAPTLQVRLSRRILSSGVG